MAVDLDLASDAFRSAQQELAGGNSAGIVLGVGVALAGGIAWLAYESAEREREHEALRAQLEAQARAQAEAEARAQAQARAQRERKQKRGDTDEIIRSQFETPVRN